MTRRAVWWWCLAYTAFAPPAARRRRRDELASHLWEAQKHGVAARMLVWASARGALDDVGWAVGSWRDGVVRRVRDPYSYVVVAAAFPIQAWLVSTAVPDHTAHPFEMVGLLGGAAFLVVAGLLWLAMRRRQD